MPQIVYIGKKTAFIGKRAFEILARLKNFGVGRYLQCTTYNREFPTEASYFKVLKVDPQMDEELTYGRVWGQEVYRGRRYPYITELQAMDPDYQLLPKDKEPDFNKYPVLGEDKSHIKKLPATMNVPPLMAEFLNRKRLGFFPNPQLKGLDKEKHGYDSKSLLDYKIAVSFAEEESEEFDFYYRYAKDDEKADIDLSKLFVYKDLMTEKPHEMLNPPAET
jgi:hypothetical protein